MKRVKFSAKIPNEAGLDDVFKPVEVAVKKACAAGEMGAVFCQLIKNKGGGYTITGAFYHRDKAEIINDVLKLVNLDD